MTRVFTLQTILLIAAMSALPFGGTVEAQHYGERGRKITMVERLLRPGAGTKVELHDEPIIAVDVVARRERGSTETQLSAEIEDILQLGPKQVDRNVNHVIGWQVGGANPRGNELILRAINGEVYVESVHVIYDSDRYDDSARSYRRRPFDRDDYYDRDRHYDRERRYREYDGSRYRDDNGYYREDRYYDRD